MSPTCDVEQSHFDGLSIAQQQRLSALLDEYLACLEHGQPLDREQLIARSPDLAGPFQEYLDSLEFLQNAAAGFAPSTMAAEASADQAGNEHVVGENRIGDFRIVEEVGRGGMGIVYEAWQLSLDRRVALKVLPFASLLDGKQIARFRNEAQAAARLHHPNIVPVFAVGTERGVHYYAMQFIDGQPLDRVISALCRTARSRENQSRCTTGSDSSTLTTAYADDPSSYFQNVARLGVQAATALHAAHEEGIVHRDIKPSNLLLDESGKLWVADFGLARCRADSDLTGSGDLVGTLRYMSPEQAGGSAAIVDHRSDVYSLGATLYELLTLRQAVRGGDAVEIVRRIDRAEPYLPRQWDANIPLDLETIVLKTMAKSPDGRYATAQEMADDLQRFLTGQPIIARRPTLADRIGKWTWRHKHAAMVSAFVMSLAIVGLAIGMVLLTRQSHRTAQALTTAQKNHQQYRRQLARTKNHMAMLQEQQGDVQAADSSFREAARLQREIVAEDPTDETTLRDLSTTLNNLGFLRSRTDVKGAAIAYDESLDVLRRLTDLTPENTVARKDLALATSNLGALYRRQGDPHRAVESLGRACALFDALAMQLDSGGGHDLAVSYNNLGMAQTDLDRLEFAEASFLAALRATERSTERMVATAGQSSAIGGIYNNLGLVQEKQQRLSDAAASYSQAIRFQRRAHLKSPQVARFGELLNRHYKQGSRVMRQMGHYHQAAQWVAARQALRPQDARRLWSVAEQWALLARDVNREEGGERGMASGVSPHEALAMAALRQAISLGLTPTPDMVESDLARLLQDANDVREWFATAKASS
ncbi:MAG TPA: serine/threonine-protein kinase [Pirellulaceae bacterium]|nr:serine/threonine-protein kinase [Pirellulaceae bacterium]